MERPPRMAQLAVAELMLRRLSVGDGFCVKCGRPCKKEEYHDDDDDDYHYCSADCQEQDRVRRQLRREPAAAAAQSCALSGCGAPTLGPVRLCGGGQRRRRVGYCSELHAIVDRARHRRCAHCLVCGCTLQEEVAPSPTPQACSYACMRAFRRAVMLLEGGACSSPGAVSQMAWAELQRGDAGTASPEATKDKPRRRANAKTRRRRETTLTVPVTTGEELPLPSPQFIITPVTPCEPSIASVACTI